MTGQAFFVLAALADGPRHGYGIVGEVAELSQGRVKLKIGSLYGVLERLAAEGMIEPDREEAHDGRLRRYYRLTQDGRRELAQEAELRAATARVVRARLTLAGPATDLPFQRRPRLLSVLASALAAAGTVLALAGCSHITPLGPGPAPVGLPPARDLGSPIIVQAMRSQSPTSTGQCPAGSVSLFGLEPNVPRLALASSRPVQAGTGSTATPTPAATPATPPTGVACYLPVGTAVTITSAAVSSVTANRNQPGPAWYEFVVAFPAAEVAALTAVIRRAYDAGDALGMSVAGKLWQAPQPRGKFVALRAEQINLLSRSQAFQLYRLLVPPG
jgi:PadR family transcriptional regulator, regulatory protein PadR